MAGPQQRAVVSRSAAEPEMLFGVVKKVFSKKEDPNVAAFRSSLAGMDSLSGLSEMKLEREEKEGRVAGEWKEYIKNDGRKWCAAASLERPAASLRRIFSLV